MHENILLDNLLLVLGIHDQCLGVSPSRQCQAWFDQLPLYPGRPIRGRNGYGIAIHTNRIVPSPEPHLGDDTQGRVLLQLSNLITKGAPRAPADAISRTYNDYVHRRDLIEQERLTTDSVACGQWPCFQSCDGHHTVVRLIKGRAAQNLPNYLDLTLPVTAASVQTELLSWGHHCEIKFLEELHLAICFELLEEVLPIQSHIYIEDTFKDPLQPLYQEMHEGLASEVQAMTFLYQQGYTKAVVSRTFALCQHSFLVLFCESHGSMEPKASKLRPPPKWPAPQPIGTADLMFWPSTVCIKFNRLPSDVGCWWGQAPPRFLDVPTLPFILRSMDLIFHAIFMHSWHVCRCLGIEHLIDTSSTLMAHPRDTKTIPIEWIEEQGTPDALIALAEIPPSERNPHQLYLVGWTSQQVRLDPGSDYDYYLGSRNTGSLAEWEGMFWSLLWRIGLKPQYPSPGKRPKALLRAWPVLSLSAWSISAFGDCPSSRSPLDWAHGHNGEPFNDFTDHVAKIEANTSLFLPRPPLSMQSSRPLLPHLWLLFGQKIGGPQLCGDHFQVPAPKLPPQHDPEPVGTTRKRTSTQESQEVKQHLSSCTANVLSMYNYPDGYSGKVGYLTAQFQAHALLFAGIQEARTPAGQCRSDHTLRLCSGADHAHGGVELWINLQQPYSYANHKPLKLTYQTAQVLHSDPRRLLVHVVAPHLDIVIFVGHAPHSGRPEPERADWWNETTMLLRQFCGSSWPLVLIDANAAPGDRDHMTVFSDVFRSSKSTPLWRRFLEELPQTMDFHQGGLDTWTIAVPQHSIQHCTHSTLLESFDLGNDRQDHTPLALELQWHLFDQEHVAPQSRSRILCDRTSIRSSNFDMLLANLPAISWDMDVETQTRLFSNEVLRELQRRCPLQRGGPKKSFITPEIWGLRQHKLGCRQLLKESRRRRARELLSNAFKSWQATHTETEGSPPLFVSDFTTTLLCGTLRCFADFRQAARRLEKELKQAKQGGIADKIYDLPPLASASAILHALRPLLGSSNLKAKALAPLPHILNEHGRPCRSPAEAQDRWINFFCNMEGGQRVQAAEQRLIWLDKLKFLSPRYQHWRHWKMLSER